jgi:glc operon protein GlcG
MSGSSARAPSGEWISWLVDAAKSEARQLGVTFSFAVVDIGAHLLYFERQLGAPLFSVRLSQDKAYTAATTGRATAEWSDEVRNDLVVSRGLMTLPRFTSLPGGVPVLSDGRALGAFGVSGGTWRQDAAVAQAALAALAGPGTYTARHAG